MVRVDHRNSFTHSFGDRKFKIRAPTGLVSSEVLPLVCNSHLLTLCLHGAHASLCPDVLFHKDTNQTGLNEFKPPGLWCDIMAARGNRCSDFLWLLFIFSSIILLFIITCKFTSLNQQRKSTENLPLEQVYQISPERKLERPRLRAHDNPGWSYVNSITSVKTPYWNKMPFTATGG